MFQDRFADKVESGLKPHTIRKARKRPIAVGDRLSLRKWLGKPYRSKQKILRESECKDVREIEITNHGFYINRGTNWLILGNDWCERLAKKDGFANAREMIQWFDDTHGLPFIGNLIEWSVAPSATKES